MRLRPEQANFDAAQELHAQLSARLLLDGEVVKGDGTRRLERRLPNGFIALLHDYTSTIHKEASQTSPGELLKSGRAFLGCSILSHDPALQRFSQAKDVFIYRPHDVDPNAIAGFALRQAAEYTPEDALIAAFKLSDPLRLVPLLDPAGHDTIQQFI